MKTEERIILRPRDIKEMTGLGKTQTYQLWRRSDFPGKRHGKSLFVSREAFLEWLKRKDE